MLFRQCCSLRHGLVFQFSAGLKIENCSQFSIFVFSAKTFQIVDRTTQEGERGVYSHVNFLPLAPSPQIPFPPCEFFFFAPDPLPLPPLPRHSSLERRKQEIRIYSVVTFPNMNDFSAEYTKDLVITQRKTDSEVSLLLKERFPGKKGRGQLRGFV